MHRAAAAAKCRKRGAGRPKESRPVWQHRAAGGAGQDARAGTLDQRWVWWWASAWTWPLLEERIRGTICHRAEMPTRV